MPTSRQPLAKITFSPTVRLLKHRLIPMSTSGTSLASYTYLSCTRHTKTQWCIWHRIRTRSLLQNPQHIIQLSPWLHSAICSLWLDTLQNVDISAWKPPFWPYPQFLTTQVHDANHGQFIWMFKCRAATMKHHILTVKLQGGPPLSPVHCLDWIVSLSIWTFLELW